MPYQLAPLQSGSNGVASAPSYDVEPSVALPRRPGAVARRSPGIGARGPVDPADRRTARRDPAGRARGPGGCPARRGPAAPAPDVLRSAPSGPAAIGAARGVGAHRGRPPTPAPDRARASRGTRPPRRSCSYAAWIGQEPRQRRRPGRVGVVLLGQPAIRALDLGRATRRAAGRGCDRDRARGHRDGSFAPGLGRRPWSGTGVRRRRRRQPISSPTGASTNSATASAPTRPCGSSVTGPVVSGEGAHRPAVEHARLPERLDRCRPGARDRSRRRPRS